MSRYLVQMVGQPAQPIISVDAHSAMLAVAEAAGCDWRAVCLPIWRQRPEHWWREPQRLGVECYMPRDDSGRQWLVREAPA